MFETDFNAADDAVQCQSEPSCSILTLIYLHGGLRQVDMDVPAIHSYGLK